MMKYLKNFKAFWLLELVLFIIGFFLVYHEFVKSGEPLTATPKTGETAPRQSAPNTKPPQQPQGKTVLETAVVCLDVDAEKYKPLLAKGRFSRHIDVLYCFTEISGYVPNVLVHDWVWENHAPMRQQVRTNGESRVWSQMSMSPDKVGAWRVEVRTESGALLGSAEFVLR